MHNKELKILLFIIWFTALIGLIIYNPFLSLKLIGDEELTVTLGDQYNDLGVDATFFGQKIQNEVIVTGNVDTSSINTYELIYTIKKGLAQRNITRIVKIVDNIAPELNLLGDKEYVLCGRDFVEQGYRATDNYDGDITGKVLTERHNDRIIYKVKDSNGNETTTERILNSHDSIKPTISLNGASLLTIKLNGIYEEYGVQVVDNCDGKILDNIKIENEIDTSKVGDYIVTYTANDTSDNEVKVTRTVKVFNENDMNDGYEETVKGPTYIKGILIVNKKYSIPSNFGGLNTEANEELKKMQTEADTLGYNLKLKSGYRSYSTQTAIYNRYVKNYGLTYANQRSAKPGHSEHQTGLAFDIGQVSQSFGNTESGKWLASNCYKYGFIIRYPKGKELITGYSYEPWHVRYVGIPVATEIMQSNLTLEEYLGIFK